MARTVTGKSLRLLLNNSQDVSLTKNARTVLERSGRFSSIVPKVFLSNSQITTTSFPEFEGLTEIRSHQDLHSLSLNSPELFWGKLARSRLHWFKDFDKVKDCDLKEGKIKWFVNGSLNVSGRQYIVMDKFNNEE